jgi:hypothetical protein
VTTSAVDDDDPHDFVDFSSAAIYLPAFQTITATVAAAATTVACCALIPLEFVSSVRTAVLAAIVGCVLIRHPFSMGRVHGLMIVFRALQPCVAFYVASLVAEQLVHSCTRDLNPQPWRRLVAHVATGGMVVAGFVRARKPLSTTDTSFLLASASLLLLALLPPPAVALSGPLCAPPTLFGAAERIVRAFVFALVYCVFVYAAAPPAKCSGEVCVCVMRAFSASAWIATCHMYLLPIGFVQVAVVIFVRVFSSEYKLDDNYVSVPQSGTVTPADEASPDPPTDAPPPVEPTDGAVASPPDTPTIDAAGATDGAAASATDVLTDQSPDAGLIDVAAPSNPISFAIPDPSIASIITPDFNGIGPRTFVDVSLQQGVSDASQQQLLHAAAARLEAEAV